MPLVIASLAIISAITANNIADDNILLKQQNAQAKLLSSYPGLSTPSYTLDLHVSHRYTYQGYNTSDTTTTTTTTTIGLYNMDDNSYLLPCHYDDWTIYMYYTSKTSDISSLFCDIVTDVVTSTVDDIDWELVNSKLKHHKPDRFVAYNKQLDCIEFVDNYSNGSSGLPEIPWYIGVHDSRNGLIFSDIPILLDDTAELAELKWSIDAASSYRGAVLQVDTRLLIGIDRLQHVTNSNDVTDGSTDDTRLTSICRSMQVAFHTNNSGLYSDSNFLFTVMSGFNSKQQLLTYLYDLCHVTPTAISIYDHNQEYDSDGSNNRKSNRNSIIYNDCNNTFSAVHKIVNVDDRVAKEHASKLPFIYYIEEVIGLGMSHDSITYVSNIGIDLLLHDSKLHQYNSGDRMTYFHDTIAVIRAYWGYLHTAPLLSPALPRLKVTSILHDYFTPNGNCNTDSTSVDSKATHTDIDKLLIEDITVGQHIGVNPDYVTRVSDGHAYVMLFVLPEQLQAAQELVQKWKTSCSYVHVCAFFMKYFINVVYPVDVDTYLNNSYVADRHQWSSNKCYDTLSQKPSLRSSLLQAKELIDEFVNAKDIVIVLMGLENAHSFPLPSTVSYPDGIIPPADSGSNHAYNLISDIVVGNRRQHEHSPSSYSDWELGAFVGVGTTVGRMIDKILTHESYAMTHSNTLKSEESLQRTFHKYIEMNKRVIQLDSTKRLFNLVSEMNRDDVIASYTKGRSSVCLLKSNHELASKYRVMPVLASLGLADGIEIDDDVVAIVSSTFPIFDDSVVACDAFNATHALEVLHILQKYVDSVEAFGAIARVVHALYASVMSSFKGDVCYLSSDMIHSMLSVAGSTMLQLGLKNKLYSAFETISNHYDNIDIINKMLGHEHVHKRHNNSEVYEVFQSSLYAALACIRQEIGPFSGMAAAASKSIYHTLTPYTSYIAGKREWYSQRDNLSIDDASNKHKMHVLTMASYASVGLDNLRTSALVAGVDLHVVGLGGGFKSYIDKVRRYMEYVSVVDDDDMVLIIDAFDVLLFPAVRNIGYILEASETPIIACSEFLNYPEMSTSLLYRKGHHKSSSYAGETSRMQRYLNSGCIVGRAGQVKSLMTFSIANGDIIYDDQALYTRYLIAHPDQMSLDYMNKIFFTTNAVGKFVNLNLVMSPDMLFNMRFTEDDYEVHGVAVLHCNNVNGTTLYNMFSSHLVGQYQTYLSGPEGPTLLKVIHTLIDSVYSRSSCRWNGFAFGTTTLSSTPYAIDDNFNYITNDRENLVLKARSMFAADNALWSSLIIHGGSNALANDIYIAVEAQLEYCKQ